MQRSDCLICHKPTGSLLAGGDIETCCGVCRKALAQARESVGLYFANYSRKRVVAGCEVCGAQVKIAASSGRPQKFCSRSCRNRANARHGSKDLDISCSECGESFHTRNPQQKYCSAACRDESAKSRRRTEAGGTHERRCRKYGREYIALDPHDIFERDHWVCQICFAPVDQDTVFPDPLAATLDHIVPLSRGGHHVEENLRTAHWGCNATKHDKLDEEINWQAVDPKHQRTF